MKGFLTLTIYSLLAAPAAFANGEGLTIREKARGAAGVDEEYVDELKTRDAALQRESNSREKMESNPRNPAMVESFEGVSSDKTQQKKEKKVKEKKSGGY